MKTLQYKGLTISENSEAYQIWLSKDFKKLDAHLKQLDEKARRLEGR